MFRDTEYLRPPARPCRGITLTKSGFDLPSPYESANVFEQAVNFALGFAEGSFVYPDLNLSAFQFLLNYHGQLPA